MRNGDIRDSLGERNAFPGCWNRASRSEEVVGVQFWKWIEPVSESQRCVPSVNVTRWPNSGLSCKCFRDVSDSCPVSKTFAREPTSYTLSSLSFLSLSLSLSPSPALLRIRLASVKTLCDLRHAITPSGTTLFFHSKYSILRCTFPPLVEYR